MEEPEITTVARYVGRSSPAGSRELWWAPPDGAPWERLAAGNESIDAAEAIVLHATGDREIAQRDAHRFRATFFDQQSPDGHLVVEASTVERWLHDRGITLAPGWSPLGPQPVVESTRAASGVERYTVALDGWQLLRVDLPGPEPVAIVGVTDLKSHRELRWSKQVATAERGDDHEPGADGTRVTAETLPFGGWAIQVDGFDVVILERNSAAPTDVRVAVYDRTLDSGFLVFDESVRYRQLATEPVATGELLRRFSGAAGRDRVLGR
jgi:hypothetical protein